MITHTLSRLVNLENTYGPYCNPNNKFTPDAGVVRYAGFVDHLEGDIEPAR